MRQDGGTSVNGFTNIKVKTRLARNALDHNLIWDAKSIAAAKSPKC